MIYEEDERTCKNCLFREQNENVYPCSRCVNNAPQDNLFEPSFRDGQWIPCSERLPKTNEWVMLCDTVGNISIGQRAEPEATWDWFRLSATRITYESDYRDIIAWMPLPEPYKEGE